MRLALPAVAEPDGRARRQCARPAGRTDVSRCAVDNVQAFLPAGMASLGRKESNPQPSALETGALPLSYVPVK
jgi:hypothetical protein